MDDRRHRETPGSAQAPPVVKRTTEAREGVTGHNVRYVLAVGLVAVVVAFGVAYALTIGWH